MVSSRNTIAGFVLTLFCLTFLVTLLYVFSSGSVAASSLDCSRVTTKTDKTICNDPMLRSLDELFFGLSDSPYVLANETPSIRLQRSDHVQACKGEKNCIINSYVEQIEALAIDPEICNARCFEPKVLLFVDPLSRKEHWFLDVVSSGGAYNLNEKLLYFDGNSISLAKFLVPAFNDVYISETCDKGAFDLSFSKFEISQENWGYLEAREPESESSSQIMEGTSWFKGLVSDVSTRGTDLRFN